ncbi:MAG: single-stranded DNA-binding protein [Porphyromonas sp.]|nr:single-stranded DNA-binding protein [Porphyromonas sp.]
MRKENRTYNHITLVGNVGQEPKIKYIDPEVCSARFSLATNTEGKLDSKGMPVVGEITDWHSILCYRDLAKEVELSIRPGMLVRVEGRLTYQQWRTNRGDRRKSAVILAEKIEVIAEPKPKEEQESSPAKASTAPYDKYLDTLAKDHSEIPF